MIQSEEGRKETRIIARNEHYSYRLGCCCCTHWMEKIYQNGKMMFFVFSTKKASPISISSCCFHPIQSDAISMNTEQEIRITCTRTPKSIAIGNHRAVGRIRDEILWYIGN